MTAQIDNEPEAKKVQGRLAESIALHVLLPLLTGGLIYIGMRSHKMLMFEWFDLLHITPIVDLIRTFSTLLSVNLPGWLLFSLPDALWLYSLTVLLGLLWVNAPTQDRYFFMALGPLLGIGSEILQFWNVLPGTFDIQDLGLLLIASILAFMIVYSKRNIAMV